MTVTMHASLKTTSV